MNKQDDSRTIHVSTTGDDTADGTSANPLRTLSAAQSVSRGARREGVGASVIIAAGTYRIDDTIVFDAADSGRDGRPVTWSAAEPGSVRLTGGVTVDTWKPVSDPTVVSRLRPEARSHVLQADLRAAGVEKFGDINPSSGNRMEVYFRGTFLELARYPDNGYLTIADVPQEGAQQFRGDVPHMRDGIPVGRHYGRFIAPDDRMSGWERRDDIYAHGYWTWDWADSFERIERFDPETREVFPAKPYHRYGYHRNQRFYFLNVLEELDAPGEWYADGETGILYLWPPEEIRPGDVSVSSTGVPLLRLDGVTHFELDGFSFAVARNSAVVMNGCSDVSVTGCTFENLGLHALKVAGGRRVRIAECDFHDLASGGIVLDGGDRKTLERGDCEVVNCRIRRFARRLLTYHYGICLSGAGNRIAHSELCDAPHSAIGWSGNDHVIELNEVHHVVTETNDAGACYNGRDPSQQGTVIRYNYWHHIGGAEGHGTNSIYFDDALCGNTVFGNVFFRGGVPGKAFMGAVFIHGGRYNRIENNVFIDCPQAYGESPWSAETWEKYSGIHGWHERLHVAVEIDEPPYAERYPWMRNIMHDTRPNVLARNLVCRCDRFLGRGEQKLEDNLETPTLPGSVSVEKADGEEHLVVDGGIIRFEGIDGFTDIPFGHIGIVRGE